MKLLVSLALVNLSLQAIPVEYNLDKALEIKLGWSFRIGPGVYLQHQCSTGSAVRLQQHARDYTAMMQEKLGIPADEATLQMRLHSNAQVYRGRMRFSREREGHYNSVRDILTSHCAASNSVLNQQLLLRILRDEHLRPWQGIFIAEVLAANGSRAYFANDAKADGAPLLQTLLSNYTPGKAERATLGRLAKYLQELGQLENFAVALVRDKRYDDTGLELLEATTGESIRALQTKLTKPATNTQRNNTLRKLKR